ncbi:hypothetical protein KAI52_02790 [Candidatus Parcubacteria bacterium]|nr:hypothetical protein [Candidatus Parcubacteria bacterium]
MSFSLSILLLPYFIFLAIFFIFVFFNFYHLFRFGFRSLLVDFIAALFCIGIASILTVSFLNIAEIDWNIAINLF